MTCLKCMDCLATFGTKWLCIFTGKSGAWQNSIETRNQFWPGDVWWQKCGYHWFRWWYGRSPVWVHARLGVFQNNWSHPYFPFTNESSSLWIKAVMSYLFLWMKKNIFWNVLFRESLLNITLKGLLRILIRSGLKNISLTIWLLAFTVHSQNCTTWFMFCCSGFYPYLSGLLCWLWSSHEICPSVSVAVLRYMGKFIPWIHKN